MFQYFCLDPDILPGAARDERDPADVPPPPRPRAVRPHRGPVQTGAGRGRAQGQLLLRPLLRGAQELHRTEVGGVCCVDILSPTPAQVRAAGGQAGGGAGAAQVPRVRRHPARAAAGLPAGRARAQAQARPPRDLQQETPAIVTQPGDCLLLLSLPTVKCYSRL